MLRMRSWNFSLILIYYDLILVFFWLFLCGWLCDHVFVEWTSQLVAVFVAYALLAFAKSLTNNFHDSRMPYNTQHIASG